MIGAGQERAAAADSMLQADTSRSELKGRVAPHAA